MSSPRCCLRFGNASAPACAPESLSMNPPDPVRKRMLLETLETPTLTKAELSELLFELDLEALQASRLPSYVPLPRQQPVWRDLAAPTRSRTR